MIKKLFLLVLLLKVSIGLLAQNNTLEDQFNEAIKKSNSYKEFKVIKKATIYNLQENVIDTLKLLRQNLDTLSVEKEQHKNVITTLKKDLVTFQNKLSDAEKNEDAIKIFGMVTKKSIYNFFIFTIIGILILIVFILLFKYKNSNSVTKLTTISLKENEDEFELFRQRSIE